MNNYGQPKGDAGGMDFIEFKEVFLTSGELGILLDGFNSQHGGIVESHEEKMGPDAGGTKQVMNFEVRLKGSEGKLIYYQENKSGKDGYCIAIPDHKGEHYDYVKYSGPVNEQLASKFQKDFLDWCIQWYKNRN